MHNCIKFNIKSIIAQDEEDGVDISGYTPIIWSIYRL